MTSVVNFQSTMNKRETYPDAEIYQPGLYKESEQPLCIRAAQAISQTAPNRAMECPGEQHSFSCSGGIKWCQGTYQDLYQIMPVETALVATDNENDALAKCWPTFESVRVGSYSAPDVTVRIRSPRWRPDQHGISASREEIEGGEHGKRTQGRKPHYTRDSHNWRVFPQRPGSPNHHGIANKKLS
jgi:hypothetical protein